jgi:hypothetical protein
MLYYELLTVLTYYVFIVLLFLYVYLADDCISFDCESFYPLVTVAERLYCNPLLNNAISLGVNWTRIQVCNTIINL